MENGKIYLISDASRKVEVESHVLRYWEDELKLPVKRNEQSGPQGIGTDDFFSITCLPVVLP